MVVKVAGRVEEKVEIMVEDVAVEKGVSFRENLEHVVNVVLTTGRVCA